MHNYLLFTYMLLDDSEFMLDYIKKMYKKF